MVMHTEPARDELLEAVRLIERRVQRNPMNGDGSNYNLQMVLKDLANLYPDRLPRLLERAQRWRR